MVNYLKKPFIKKGKLKVKKKKDGLILENYGSKPAYLLYIRGLRHRKENMKVSFQGKIIKGTPPDLIKMNYKGKYRGFVDFNTNAVLKKNTSFFYPVIKVFPGSKIEVDSLTFEETDNYSVVDYDQYKGDILVITPTYPSLKNKYANTFVYSKVKEYLKAGLKVDVVCASASNQSIWSYYYDNKYIAVASYGELRNIIQKNKYKKILMHFLDTEFGRVLENCYLNDTEIIVYCHGSDVDLWNQNIYGTYFDGDYVFSDKQIEEKKKREETLKKFDSKTNVKWIFNTEWNYENAKKRTGLEFKNHEIIPCIISKEDFPFKKRNSKLRKKILILKKMGYERQYAVDIAVRTILELSKKDFFDDLEFTIVGDGPMQETLVSPVKEFKNVKIEKKFYSHDKMNDLFNEHGILLVPSRYDTQGVTAGEAAMSGMVLVASKDTGMSSMLDENIGTFFDIENFEEAASIIEKLYKNPKLFEQKSIDFRKAIEKTANEKLIEKEIKLLKEETIIVEDKLNIIPSKKPILSIIVPCYNVEQYIKKSLYSLVTAKNASDLEIIVVNDGSKDDTLKIIKQVNDFVKHSKTSSIIKIIDKKNGGHGSTINAGLKNATGKYFRLMDGDDQLITENLDLHIDFLKKTDADLVFTNYMEDRAQNSEERIMYNYKFMTPYKVYNFDDLCYEKYGFPGYGPILSTTSVKTKLLKDVNMKITENCFYVDTEYNYFITLASKTAVLQPIVLYKYYIGRENQSISKQSYMKNYLQHQKVTISLLDKISEGKLSKLKADHFIRVQVIENVRHQYVIAIYYFESRKKFLEVDNIIKKYDFIYNNDIYTDSLIKTLRRTKGHFFKLILFAHKIKNKIKGR